MRLEQKFDYRHDNNLAIAKKGVVAFVYMTIITRSQDILAVPLLQSFVFGFFSPTQHVKTYIRAALRLGTPSK